MFSFIIACDKQKKMKQRVSKIQWKPPKYDYLGSNHKNVGVNFINNVFFAFSLSENLSEQK